MSATRTQPGPSRFLDYFHSGWQTMLPRIGKIGRSGGATSSNGQAVIGCLFCLEYSAAENSIMIENDAFFARFDNFPASPGHIEIVPKRHVESFFELSADEVLKAYKLMSQAKNELDEKHHAEGYTIGVNEGDASGRSITHLHIHLIPRHHGDVEDPRGGVRRVVPNWDPDLWRGSKSLQRTRA
jgi:diadenosine tetraphosphate (Ap4A) HIT family hydrolase